MPTYTIQAYQEMFAEVTVTAQSALDALASFREMIKAGAIQWCPSDEDLEAEVYSDGNELMLTSEQEA